MFQNIDLEEKLLILTLPDYSNFLSSNLWLSFSAPLVIFVKDIKKSRSPCFDQ